MSFVTSPNMGLQIPGVGTEPGPQFAFEVNTSLNLVDQHDHTPGRGTQVPPSGLNINSDLTFQNSSATNLASAVFQNQVSISTLQALYVKPGSETPAINDLWFNDGAGNAVQLTAGGLVNATIASLPGESFAGGTFTWKQGSGSTTPANFDIGSITIRPTVAATTNGVTLSPPSGISSQYSIALPLLPSTQSFISIDNSGITNTFAPTGGPANATSLVPPPGTNGQILQTPGGSSNPVWTTLSGNTGALTVPTVTVLSSTGSQTGWLFTISTSSTLAVGDTYTNNSNTFTVQVALSSQSGQVLFMSGTGATTGSTLTRATGSGTASITFSTKIATATYTTPTSPGPLYLKVTAVGAGGGGALWANQSGGGGGGATAIKYVSTPNATYPYVIGTGGAGALSNATNGSNGLPTFFALTCKATAGLGGQGDGTQAEGGAGGADSGCIGDIKMHGSAGTGGSGTTGANQMGCGGSSTMGGGGAGGIGDGTPGGSGGGAFGGGGGGGWTGSGGTGSPGVVIVEAFFQ